MGGWTSSINVTAFSGHKKTGVFSGFFMGVRKQISFWMPTVPLRQ
jgi:hypothetical protein